MTYDKALETAKEQAKYLKRVYYVCYNDWYNSPDWRDRYIVSEYLNYPAAYPNSVKAQVFPSGVVHDCAGNPIKGV